MTAKIFIAWFFPLKKTLPKSSTEMVIRQPLAGVIVDQKGMQSFFCIFFNP
jgi:hypothetical protein